MGIPKPLVQTNQLFIVLSVVLALLVSNWILLIPFLIGVITLITRRNPIMVLGYTFLNKDKEHYVLEDPDQQIFNQWIATICLGLSFLFFRLGYVGGGYFFSIMVMAAAGIALLGYCIGCTIRYRYMMWKHKRLN
ncbi:DUF4395 domain-containing protein [Alkalihalobacillus sp. MEB130]|uniref:DUF4395 domain-containing protein n=1 Tax=Alkalihalobacillus sp. MEB130 TaxID=2976704 RepID=UPI0028E0228D|nr:DUF4395 domain-containing protein [Alkalihalobacillus sp. MEB130]MDT8861668.1 DUF4395 domain-containing protein [Alkalihalobacillus sp. MEB130]